MHLTSIFSYLGSTTLSVCSFIGSYTLFVWKTVTTIFKTRLKVAKLLVQMERIGVQSFPIAILTGTFAGAVLALQMYFGFRDLGTENMIGPIVALALTRELGPVLTGLMVTGRVGSAIAAEIGTMSITEQLDALRTLCVDRFQYLIVPRVLAAVCILPFLTVFAMFFGILGGYLVYVYYFSLNPVDYIEGIRDFLQLKDIVGGLVKGSVFGFILSTVGSFKGFTTQGGAKNVGIATTKSVVISSIAILIVNYFLAVLLFEHG